MMVFFEAARAAASRARDLDASYDLVDDGQRLREQFLEYPRLDAVRLARST